MNFDHQLESLPSGESANAISFSTSPLTLQPGCLWPRVLQATDHALRCRALQSIPTHYEFVEQGGIRFLVRLLANLTRKEEAQKQQIQQSTTAGKPSNPFLPYEQDLFVTNLSGTHLVLLNKFNVVDHHLLVVTREFEAQDTLLTLEDFEAIWACLAEIDGLAFYNGGRVAGSSQPHKHLQLVPLPLAPDGEGIPMEKAIATANFHNGLGISDLLPFQHRIARFELGDVIVPAQAAIASLACYHQLLQAVGLPCLGVVGEKQPGAYNLLLTRQWMLLVPRSQESFEGIPVNSLGFAGGLLVRNEQQMEQLKTLGPMTILTQVGRPL